MPIYKAITTPGVYRVSFPGFGVIEIDIHMWGAGGGSGALGNKSGQGGGYQHVRASLNGSTDTIKIAVGGAGEGGIERTGSDISPYGAAPGPWGGGSIAAAFNGSCMGGPGGGVNIIAPGAQVGTGGAGGGATTCQFIGPSAPTSLTFVTPGGSGSGGGIRRYPANGTTYTKTGFGPRDPSQSYYNDGTPNRGRVGLRGGGGGGGGGGFKPTGALSLAYGGSTEMAAGTGIGTSFGPIGVGYAGRSAALVDSITETVDLAFPYDLAPAGPGVAAIANPLGWFGDFSSNSTDNFGYGGISNLGGNGSAGGRGLVIIVIRNIPSVDEDLNFKYRTPYGWEDKVGEDVYVKYGGVWKLAREMYYRRASDWIKIYGAASGGAIGDIAVTSLPNEFNRLGPENVDPGGYPPPESTTYPDIEVTPSSVSVSAISLNTVTPRDDLFNIRSIGTEDLYISSIQIQNLRLAGNVYTLTTSETLSVYKSNFQDFPGGLAGNYGKDSNKIYKFGLNIVLKTSGNFTGTIVINSNAIGSKLRIELPLSMTVLTPILPPPKLDINGMVEYRSPGTYSFTVPTAAGRGLNPAEYNDVTKVTVLVQGGGASGSNGQAANYRDVVVRCGAGGGSGQLLVVKDLVVTPGGTYTVVVGGTGEPSSFWTRTAAGGQPGSAAGGSGAAEPYGGNGGDAPRVYIPGPPNPIQIIEYAGGGLGNKGSTSTAHDVPPGPGQNNPGANIYQGRINVGGNGYSATQQGAGGGGGGLDEGNEAGTGGAGAGGYVVVLFGADAAMASGINSVGGQPGSPGDTYSFSGGFEGAGKPSLRVNVYVDESISIPLGTYFSYYPVTGLIEIRNVGTESLIITNVTQTWAIGYDPIILQNYNGITTSLLSLITFRTNSLSIAGTYAPDAARYFGLSADTTDIFRVASENSSSVITVSFNTNDTSNSSYSFNIPVNVWDPREGSGG